MAATPSPLLIKRYASRRLYNTETSDYVTLEDIAAFIREGREVKIVDLKSGDDLTRQYLLQIIAEHESRGESVLPIDVLTDLVRSYTSSANSIVPQFLAASFEMLRDSQSKLMENMATIPSPMVKVPGFDAMQRQQQMFLRTLMNGWPNGSSGPDASEVEDEGTTEDSEKPEPRAEKPSHQSGPEDDMNEIRRQLAELQQRISRL